MDKPPKLTRRRLIASAAATAAVPAPRRVRAARYTGPGVSETEIRIGNTMAYSGNSAPYGVTGISEAAYFDKINRHGGINGRKIKFLSRDDALTAAKTVELTRQLVEQDDVLAIFSILGSATNHSVRAYLNQRKRAAIVLRLGRRHLGRLRALAVDHRLGTELFHRGTGFRRADPARAPNGKIAILHENTDLGRDAIAGLKDALGADYPKW